jgi:hypothetical protein
MDVPISLRFFEKLNRYQDIKRLDKRATSEWKNQRQILLWAGDVTRHRHRSVELTPEMAAEHDDVTGLEGSYVGEENAQEKRGYIIHSCFGNLVSARLAKWKSDSDWSKGIVFTREGFQMGEVINELRDNSYARVLYEGSYVLSWSIFIAGAAIAVGEAIKLLYGLFTFVTSLIGCSCR